MRARIHPSLLLMWLSYDQLLQVLALMTFPKWWTVVTCDWTEINLHPTSSYNFYFPECFIGMREAKTTCTLSKIWWQCTVSSRRLLCSPVPWMMLRQWKFCSNLVTHANPTVRKMPGCERSLLVLAFWLQIPDSGTQSCSGHMIHIMEYICEYMRGWRHRSEARALSIRESLDSIPRITHRQFWSMWLYMMLIPALDGQEMGMWEARMEYIVRKPSQKEKSKGKKEKGGGGGEKKEYKSKKRGRKKKELAWGSPRIH